MQGGGYFQNFTVLCSGLLFYHVKFHRVLYLCTRSGAHNPERTIPLWPGAQRFKLKTSYLKIDFLAKF